MERAALLQNGLEAKEGNRRRAAWETDWNRGGMGNDAHGNPEMETKRKTEKKQKQKEKRTRKNKKKKKEKKPRRQRKRERRAIRGTTSRPSQQEEEACL